MIIVNNEQEYLNLTLEQKYLVSADFTKMNKMNKVQQDYIKVKRGGFYGDTIFAIMYKKSKVNNQDDIRDFFAIGYEEVSGELVATGITDFTDVTFYTKQSARDWVEQFHEGST